jgi:hypothetical protein
MMKLKILRSRILRPSKECTPYWLREPMVPEWYSSDLVMDELAESFARLSLRDEEPMEVDPPGWLEESRARSAAEAEAEAEAEVESTDSAASGKASRSKRSAASLAASEEARQRDVSFSEWGDCEPDDCEPDDYDHDAYDRERE